LLLELNFKKGRPPQASPLFLSCIRCSDVTRNIPYVFFIVAATVALLPAASTARTVITLLPRTRLLIVQLHAVPDAYETGPTVADVSTVTETDAPLSLVPDIVWAEFFVGDVTGLIVIAGAAVSTIKVT
jgi:hypothetical protein